KGSTGAPRAPGESTSTGFPNRKRPDNPKRRLKSATVAKRTACPGRQQSMSEPSPGALLLFAGGPDRRLHHLRSPEILRKNPGADQHWLWLQPTSDRRLQTPVVIGEPWRRSRLRCRWVRAAGRGWGHPGYPLGRDFQKR